MSTDTHVLVLGAHAALRTGILHRTRAGHDIICAKVMLLFALMDLLVHFSAHLVRHSFIIGFSHSFATVIKLPLKIFGHLHFQKFSSRNFSSFLPM